MRLRLFSIIACLGIAGSAAAQPQPAPSPTPSPQPQPQPTPPAPAPTSDAAKTTVDGRLKALEDDLEDLQDENKDLHSELDDLKQKAAVRPPTSLSAMNPSITAFLNGAARADSKAVFTPDGTRIDDRPFMRTMEVDFRAAVDPYADAVGILALDNNAGKGFEADLEEGFVILKRLPILESAPLGLKLKLGRYRAPIGNLNRVHMHDMPWTTWPQPIATLLGTENGPFFESGYVATGADAEVILPEIISGAVMELNADVVDGGDLAISDRNARHIPAYLGHYNLFFTVARRARLQHRRVGVQRGRQPARAAGRGGLPLQVEAARGRRVSQRGARRRSGSGPSAGFASTSDGDGVPEPVTLKTTPMAWYAYAQYQASWHVYLGGRFDYAQDINDTALTTKVAAGYISYYTSEFLRFRLGYEHRWSDVPARGQREFGHGRSQRRLRLTPHRTLLGQSLIGVTMRTIILSFILAALAITPANAAPKKVNVVTTLNFLSADHEGHRRRQGVGHRARKADAGSAQPRRQADVQGPREERAAVRRARSRSRQVGLGRDRCVGQSRHPDRSEGPRRRVRGHRDEGAPRDALEGVGRHPSVRQSARLARSGQRQADREEHRRRADARRSDATRRPTPRTSRRSRRRSTTHCMATRSSRNTDRASSSACRAATS